MRFTRRSAGSIRRSALSRHTACARPRTRRCEGAVAVERTVLVVEDDGWAVLNALENPPPAIVKPVFDVDTDDQVRIAAAIGPAAPA